MSEKWGEESPPDFVKWSQEQYDQYNKCLYCQGCFRKEMFVNNFAGGKAGEEKEKKKPPNKSVEEANVGKAMLCTWNGYTFSLSHTKLQTRA